MPSHAPLRLIAIVRSQRASSVVSTVPRGLMPAQLTSRSSPPHRRCERRHHAAPVAGARHIEVLADRLKPLSAQVGRPTRGPVRPRYRRARPCKRPRPVNGRSPGRSPGPPPSPVRPFAPLVRMLRSIRLVLRSLSRSEQSNSSCGSWHPAGCLRNRATIDGRNIFATIFTGIVIEISRDFDVRIDALEVEALRWDRVSVSDIA